MKQKQINKTEVYLIRHGQTEWNALGIMQGQKDVMLNDVGHRQAQILAKRLANTKFTAIYSSDLKRASDTAATVAALQNLSVKLDKRLRERCFGIFEGCTKVELIEKHPETYQLFLDGKDGAVVPGGEAEREIQNRTIECLTEIAQHHTGEKILVITHGGIIKRFTKYVLGIENTSGRISAIINTAINIFQYENGKWALRTFGDTAHIESTKEHHNE